MLFAAQWLVAGALAALARPPHHDTRAAPAWHRRAVVAASPRTDPSLIDWKLLGELNVDDGTAPAAVRAIDGKRVKIAAFIVPLEDDLQEADEFLLVPYFGACIHTPPPPPNQMIYVKMSGHKRIKIGWRDPVVFEGVIHVWRVDSPYGAVSYDMDGVSASPYTPTNR